MARLNHRHEHEQYGVTRRRIADFISGAGPCTAANVAGNLDLTKRLVNNCLYTMLGEGTVVRQNVHPPLWEMTRRRADAVDEDNVDEKMDNVFTRPVARLNTICQQLNIPTPQYSFRSVGTIHMAMFVATVKIGDRVFGPGAAMPNKRSAKEHVADIALNCIANGITSPGQVRE